MEIPFRWTRGVKRPWQSLRQMKAPAEEAVNHKTVYMLVSDYQYELGTLTAFSDSCGLELEPSDADLNALSSGVALMKAGGSTSKSSSLLQVSTVTITVERLTITVSRSCQLCTALMWRILTSLLKTDLQPSLRLVIHHMKTESILAF